MEEKITQNINNVTENEKKQFIFDDEGEKSTVTVWCDGRDYDPYTEGYRPVYSYQITTREWNYTANDIRGAVNEVPNLYSASQSLFAFLYTSCKSSDEEDRMMFPDYVREWADKFIDELEVLCIQASKVVTPTVVQEPDAPPEPEDDDVFGLDDDG